ncbi:MAG: DUF342 domain-containing protein [Lachnospiraceae bacterium]|nr:DUF342 domain-containing protein [Lachnospiraceae bacterium]
MSDEAKEVNNIENNNIQIFVSEDVMEAFLLLKKPEENAPGYTLEEVMNVITANGIKGEIDKELIQYMIINGVYDEKRLFVQGHPMQNGIDAYFEYFFHEQDKEGKPRILDDGSVDYTSVHTVGTVSEGDLIAKYHPSVPGHFGYNVRGELLKPEQPRAYPVPQLMGVRYDQDTYSYYATIDGKVEATFSKIVVEGTLEIRKNVSIAYGNICFIGDVEIKGDVDSGVEIYATGSVKINGTVQGSSIVAGENVTIGGGIIGKKDIHIDCGGNLTVGFMQNVNVQVGGNITTGSTFGCNIYCGGTLKVAGSKGSIYAGKIYSMHGIEGHVFGNEKGIITYVSAGKRSELLTDRMSLLKEIEELSSKSKGINSRELALSRKIKEAPSSVLENALHVIRKDKARILAEKKQKEEVLNAINRLFAGESFSASITGTKFFTGVTVSIDMKEKEIESDITRVTFLRNEDGIYMVQ